VDRGTASVQKCREDAQNRSIAVMENSVLLSNAQRAAQSGPNKVSADKIRAHFTAMSNVSLNPYFAPQDDSTSALPDELAQKFPLQLQYFLPEEQRNRLVNYAQFIFVNFLTSRILWTT